MRVVDLFCGTGGFSHGAHRAGLNVVRAFDIDPVLTSSFDYNFPQTPLTLADMIDLSGAAVLRDAGHPIDGLIGGPPCQSFSTIGQRNVKDPRRLLLYHFFRLVAEIKPTFFVMENVVGLNQGAARRSLYDAMERVPTHYKIAGPMTLNAADFGAATTRKRVFVVGVDPTRGTLPDMEALAKSSPATVRDAITDLATAVSVGDDADGFDIWRLPATDNMSEYAKALRSADGCFTGNRRTVHSEQVIKRFEGLAQGETDEVGRHPRLDWNGRCPTLRAGTGSDKGSYQSVRPIHPTEHRVITVREAARLQGFPDNHRFHRTMWHSFRMIGNSVSPFMAHAILSAVAECCEAIVPSAEPYLQVAE